MIGPHGVPVEVQIRTEDMDQMAEMGVAAHWAYKEHGETSTTAQIAQRWMQSLLELQQSAGSSFEFIESVKSDLFPDGYVFTPEGRIVELPARCNARRLRLCSACRYRSCLRGRVDRQPYRCRSRLPAVKPLNHYRGRSPGNAAWLKLATLDDLLAEIGLGNAMSVVVAKSTTWGRLHSTGDSKHARASADQRR